MLLEISGFSKKMPHLIKWEERLIIHLESKSIIQSGALLENDLNSLQVLQKGIEYYPGAYDIDKDKFILVFKEFLSEDLIKKIKNDYIQVEFFPEDKLT